MTEKVKTPMNLPRKVSFLEGEENFNPTKEYWERFLQRKNARKSFTLMFGPPFTSGEIHLGTAYSELVKDTLCAMHFNLGKQVILRPGFDCHGLPTERMVQEQTSCKLTGAILWKKCYSQSRRNLIYQIRHFRNLGILASWDNAYVTSSQSYIKHVIDTLERLVKLNQDYWGFKELDFCVKTNTIVPFSELERRVVKKPNLTCLLDTTVKGLKVAIFTNTPWNLVSNNGVAFNPKLRYSVFKFKDFEVIAYSESTQFERKIRDITKSELQEVLLFADLEKSYPLVEASWVTTEGTALVHLAGLYSKKDYEVSMKNKIKLRACFDEGYFFGNQATDTVSKANQHVLGYLGDNLVKLEWVDSVENFFTRSNQQTVRVILHQFFLKTSSIRNKVRSMRMVKSINWGSKKYEKYILNLILRNKDDWVLSRNRTFNTPLAFDESLSTYAGRLEWAEKQGLGLDVWFDSANSFTYCNDSPVDVAIEGVDQYKGYFLRSIQLHALLGIHPPMKNVISTGFILDTAGYKMSKSKRNFDKIENLINNFGSDSIRLWTLSSAFFKDIKYSERSLSDCKKKYAKIKNYLSFLSGYWKESKDLKVPLMLLPVESKWILHLLNRTYVNYVRMIVRNKPKACFETVSKFLEILSHHYIYGVKTSVYFRSLNDPDTHAILFTFKLILKALLFLLRPFVPKLIRNFNEVTFFYRSIWSFNFPKIPLWTEEFRYLQDGLTLFKSLRPFYEAKVSLGLLKNPIKTSITLPSRFKDQAKPLTFLSMWKVYIGERFRFRSYEKACRFCLREENAITLKSESCKKCKSFFNLLT